MVATKARPKKFVVKQEKPEPIPAPRTDKPWHKYRGKFPNWKLLEPGWAGVLDNDEVQFIQERLHQDDELSFWWGFRPGQKTRPEAAIRRIAVDGDPENRTANVRLARINSRIAKLGPESSSASTRKNKGGAR